MSTQMTSSPPPRAGSVATPSLFDERPAGERYYRHPGDVVRLILWGVTTAVLVVFIEVATETSDGLTTDLGRAASRAARAVRELVLALTQVLVVIVVAAIVTGLVARRRWRRLATLVLGASAGAAAVLLLDRLMDLPGRLPDAVSSGTWLASTRFPNLVLVGGAASAAVLGKPWLSRQWGRAGSLVLAAVIIAMAFAGSAGVPALLLAVAAGSTIGALLLVVFGAPNRRPSPAGVAAGLRSAGIDVESMTLERAVGGRSQLYRVTAPDGSKLFVKVYSQDSRDADLLYRASRGLLLRKADDGWPSVSLDDDVRHAALLMLLAGEAGVSVPGLRGLISLDDGSIALAMVDVGGAPLDVRPPEEIDDALLDAVWGQIAIKDRAHIAHRALRAGNILVTDGNPVLIDFGFGTGSASPRQLNIDRAELLASLATLIGPRPAVASAARVLDAADLAAAAAYLQPLALSAATRKQSTKSLLRAIREEIAEVTQQTPEPLARLTRVRPKTLLMIAALAGAFYVLLPQLANVGDSVRALRSANWWWIIACIALSGVTYVASAIGLMGGVRGHLPLGATVETQMASSFVNRVTPANVGGMALNVRFMQKAGIEPAAAVTGMGLNVIAGAIVHVVLLVVFLAWAGQRSQGFQVPAGSKVLVGIAVGLAIVGVVLATRRGRRLAKKHVVGFVQRSWSSVVGIARSPSRVAALLGGSVLVTMAYIGALAAAVAAFSGGASFAQVGAVYLGASVIAAAAPTPGGLGAMEAALVAGFTAIGVEPGIAVAAVLSYRLATYWLPILPGWLSFRHLERANMI